MKLQTLMTSIWQHLLLMVLIIMFVKCCRALESCVGIRSETWDNILARSGNVRRSMGQGLDTQLVRVSKVSTEVIEQRD